MPCLSVVDLRCQPHNAAVREGSATNSLRGRRSCPRVFSASRTFRASSGTTFDPVHERGRAIRSIAATALERLTQGRFCSSPWHAAGLLCLFDVYPIAPASGQKSVAPSVVPRYVGNSVSTYRTTSLPVT